MRSKNMQLSTRSKMDYHHFQQVQWSSCWYYVRLKRLIININWDGANILLYLCGLCFNWCGWSDLWYLGVTITFYISTLVMAFGRLWVLGVFLGGSALSPLGEMTLRLIWSQSRPRTMAGTDGGELPVVLLHQAVVLNCHKLLLLQDNTVKSCHYNLQGNLLEAVIELKWNCSSIYTKLVEQFILNLSKWLAKL